MFCRQQDKQKHFWLSAAIVLLALPWVGLLMAVMVAAVAGVAKEVWDHYYGTGFCWYDLLADTLGIISATLVRVLIM